MRTDSFSKEKHLPVRRFIADESKVATGLYGPCAIADDLDNIFNMFDPDAVFLDGSEQGGIGEKNLQSGAVSYEKLAEDVKAKFQGIATENQLSSLRTEFFETVDTKANKANTLSGYGITDAYTKEETDKTAEQFDKALNGLQEQIDKVSADSGSKETVLCEDVVNTPEWTNQPTCEDALDTAFNQQNFYYVTLKDGAGNALSNGQFMLKNSYTEDATVYSTLFTLPNLDTGFGTLTENYPVEFVTTGINFALRDAGITLYEQEPDSCDISHGTGSIRMVVQGEVIPRNANLYCYSHFKTDKNVSSYHSTNGTTAFQNDATKDIIAYTNLSELNNVGNMLFDNTILKRDGNGYFSAERSVVIRYNNKNTKVYQVFGFGKTLTDNTRIESIAFRLNNVNNGMFRNGTKIIISEVK